MRLVLTCLLVLWASSGEAANLCVKSGGSDATAKASIVYTAGDEAGSTCWATLGRAVWGNANRATPSASEAGTAGDTVFIFGGTYDTTVNLGSRSQTAYGTANNGTLGNPLVFRCLGICTLTGAEVEGVLLGQGDDYVEWRADLTAGARFVIPMCSEATSAGTDCPASGVVTAVADYPSVGCINATGVVIEGFYITLVQPVTYLDNTNGIRLEGCVDSTIRNVRIRDIQYTSASNHNRSCVTIYHSNNNVLEYLDCANARSGVFLKDTSTASPVLSGNIVRWSLFDDVGECFVWSLVTAGSTSGANHLYSNVCRDSVSALTFIGSTSDGSQNDVIANNLFYNLPNFGIGWQDTSGVTGVKIQNNIFITVVNALYANSSVTWPAAAVMDVEHNVYYDATTFYSGSDGTRTFASFNAAYTGAHNASPTAITSDPLVVDVLNGDYRLCTGSGTPAVGCSGASPAAALGVDRLDLDGDSSTVDNIPAGVYVTGTETIGLQASASSTTPVRLRIRGE